MRPFPIRTWHLSHHTVMASCLLPTLAHRLERPEMNERVSCALELIHVCSGDKRKPSQLVL